MEEKRENGIKHRHAIYRETQFQKQLKPKKDKSCKMLGCEKKKTSKHIQMSFEDFLKNIFKQQVSNDKCDL